VFGIDGAFQHPAGIPEVSFTWWAMIGGNPDDARRGGSDAHQPKASDVSLGTPQACEH
jgi:hypothetical protein